MIQFAEPQWLVVGLISIVGLIFLFRKMQQKREQKLQCFAASHLLGKLCANVSGERRAVKKILVIAAIFCCFLALARPQYGSKWVEVKRKGIDILFAVDTSNSMLAEDIRPNRLQRAKFAILDFVGQLEGDRVGLMPFAGSAYLMCPLTIDYGAFESSLDSLDTAIIPKGGTDLAAAIREAESVLSNEANHKILVFITDGENLQGDAVQAAEDAAEKGMTIYTVGVGTSEGELIPLSRNGKTGFIKDKSGKFVTSHLDETALTQIAEATGGLYVPLGTNAEGLQTIYQEKLSLIPKEELAEKRHKVPLERFVWPLGAAIILLMMEFVVSGRRSGRNFKIPFIKTAGRRDKTITALLLFFLLFPVTQYANASIGEDAYRKGDFLTASEFYDDLLTSSPEDATLHYNYGTAAYKNNMFEEAAKAFTEALKSDDLDLQEEAYFNRGNSLFQRGKETMQTDSQHTMEMWQQAVDSFDGALQLNSLNDDARFNKELVQRKLEELKQQQENQDKQDKQDQEGDQKQDKEQDQNKEGDQQQQSDQGEQQKQDGSQEEQQKQDGQQEQSEEQQGKEGSEQQDEAGSQSQQDQNAEDEEKQKNLSADDEEKQAAEESEQEAAAAAEQEEELAKERDQQRQRVGKMTREEARQLLNSLKDEEGELNFVPASGHEKDNNQAIDKDW